MTTPMNEIFSPGRFFKLFSLEARKNYRGFFITLGGVYAFFLLISLLNGYSRQYTPYLYSYLALFFVGGIVLTARTFQEYYKRERNTPLLMLPASKTEKWLEKLLLTTVGWMAASFALYTLYTLLAAGLNELIFGFHTSPIWWDAILWKCYLHYLVAHAVFFLGSAVYRKVVLFKTVLTVFVVGVVLGLVTLLFGRILFAEVWEIAVNVTRGGIEIGPQDFTPEVGSFMERLGTVSQVVYWLLIPYCWIVSFIRFTEIEVKDGV